MSDNMRDNLRFFFNRYSETRRIPLYQALVEELANIRRKTEFVDNTDSFNSLKHQFKGICRYLSFEFDAQIDEIMTPEQLYSAIEDMFGHVVAIEDEL